MRVFDVMNYLYLCKLYDYVNYSNILIEEIVGLLEFRERVGLGGGVRWGRVIG